MDYNKFFFLFVFFYFFFFGGVGSNRSLRILVPLVCSSSSSRSHGPISRSSYCRGATPSSGFPPLPPPLLLLLLLGLLLLLLLVSSRKMTSWIGYTFKLLLFFFIIIFFMLLSYSSYYYHFLLLFELLVGSFLLLFALDGPVSTNPMLHHFGWFCGRLQVGPMAWLQWIMILIRNLSIGSAGWSWGFGFSGFQRVWLDRVSGWSGIDTLLFIIIFFISYFLIVQVN